MYASSTVPGARDLPVQFGRSSDGKLAGVEVKELDLRRLGVKVRIEYPGNGVDDLAYRCLRVRLDEPTRATQIVAWDGQAPSGGNPELLIAPDQADRCPRREAVLER